MKLTTVLILTAAIMACAYGHIQSRRGSNDPRCVALPGTVETDEIICHGLYYRYTYIKDSNECQVFTYGGCGGTANNFESQFECETICNQNK